MSDEKLIPEVEEILKDLKTGAGGGVGQTTGGRGGGHPEKSYPHLSGGASGGGLVVESYTLGSGGRGSTEFPAPAPEVPEHIAKTVAGIKQYGHQWADQIEHGAREQLDADTKRYEDSMALAKRIREDADAEAAHVQSWALTTRDASLIQRQAFAKLNGSGGHVEDQEKEKGQKGHEGNT